MRVFSQRREPGFRCNVADLAMLAASLGLSLWLSSEGFGEPSWMPAYVTGTFFIFCNVTRIGPQMEVTWALVATTTCLATVPADLPFWRTVLPVTIPATVAVVTWGYLAGRYKGVFAKAGPASPGA